MSDKVPEWVHMAEIPLTVDEEPWLWTCPRCGAALPRAEVPGHVAAEDTDAPTGGAVVWAFLAWGLLALVIVAVVWGVRR